MSKYNKRLALEMSVDLAELILEDNYYCTVPEFNVYNSKYYGSGLCSLIDTLENEELITYRKADNIVKTLPIFYYSPHERERNWPRIKKLLLSR